MLSDIILIFLLPSISMIQQTRKINMLQSGIEPKTKLLVIRASALTIELLKHDEHSTFSFLNEFSVMEIEVNKNISIVSDYIYSFLFFE